MSSEGFFCCDLLSEGNAAHPFRCDSPLQIVMAIWRTFLKFELAGSGADYGLPQILKKKSAKRPLLSAAGCHTQPDHSAE
jgi:hypothetical protein